jgi:hypothetical protein
MLSDKQFLDGGEDDGANGVTELRRMSTLAVVKERPKGDAPLAQRHVTNLYMYFCIICEVRRI